MAPDGFAAFFADLTAIRRTIHENPELSFREVKTQALVRDYLINQAHIPAEKIQVCGKTGALHVEPSRHISIVGLVVDIFGPVDGSYTAQGVPKCIAFRGDMDALPMTERNPHLPYESKAQGAAHMCGHDGHTANLMGFATLLQQRRHLLPPHSKVRLLFQPAEENDYGAEAMIKDGCLDGVDEVYGYHNAAYPLGNIHVKPGPIMAQCIDFRITISGPGGHGSAPHVTKDPIVAAGHIIVAMQTITSRSISPHDTAIVSICQVHGGEADNVIPSLVVLSGTVRDFLPAVSQTIHARMKAIVENISASFGVEGKLDFHDFFPAVVNHVHATKTVQDIAASVVGAAKVSEEGLPICGAEDFAYYLEQRPGCFFFVGTKDKDDAQNRNCHSDTYDFNDAITPLAIRMFLEILNKRFQSALVHA
ncbi:hypothetical protein LEN26_007045 [Aphanomyces euteiches]|nr:hypothetical protein AeMF1_014292 [Aphanomyces euteiches]KAH9133711.1 hypothetical protein LEN26_007045 [Aphanomyces euteiches]KAH9188920.1 hypothetical protein AeNC1_009104 [Aphanomyces euteiches]